MRTLLCLVVFAMAVQAQTLGVPGSNDFTVNGLGSGTASCHALAIPAGPGVLSFRLEGVGGSPVILVAGACAPNTLPVPNGTALDLSLASLIFILDGTGIFLPAPPPILGPTGITNSAGLWTASLAANIPPGPIATLQMAQLNPAIAGGIGFSQAHAITALGLGATSLCPSTVGHDLAPLSDDGSVGIALSTPFRFYGTSYSNVFVNMNGNITFGSASSDFSANETDMLGTQPRIAVAWDDWNPSDPAQGTVRAFDSGTSLSVEWFDVRHFGTAACGLGASGFQDSNTFCVQLDYATGNVTIGFGVMILCSIGMSQSFDQVVGISPGNGISTPNNVNLSAGPSVSPAATRAIYEDFGLGAFGAFDLGPTWGSVTGIAFVGNGAGAGPYTSVPF